jgi:5-methylcytosine-specific restriction endonuclease McrA
VGRLRCEECRRLAPLGRSLCEIHGRSDPRRQADYGHDWQRMRREAITPDTLCAQCHRPGTPEDPLELDHVLPWSKGGSNERFNTQVIHRSANRAKGGRLEARQCRQ